jgi:SAM-dependent methyltransferase
VTTSYANPTVLEFYKQLPFNYQETVEDQARAIRERNSVLAYPPLADRLKPGTRVLEVGSGTGWLSNSIAHYYQSNVLGIDFNPVAVERAKAVAKALGLSTRFQVEDLFLFEPETPFDVVVSVGVLHHTDNCRAAVERVFNRFLAKSGYAFIGLYHEYGRRPFLEHFASMHKAGASEDEMFARYREMQPQLEDDVQARSWFRDQVLHPHETQHTLAEMLEILRACNMELVSTSINRWEKIKSEAALIEQEKTYREISLERLREKKYFPGFFLVLARKR